MLRARSKPHLGHFLLQQAMMWGWWQKTRLDFTLPQPPHLDRVTLPLFYVSLLCTEDYCSCVAHRASLRDDKGGFCSCHSQALLPSSKPPFPSANALILQLRCQRESFSQPILAHGSWQAPGAEQHLYTDTHCRGNLDLTTISKGCLRVSKRAPMSPPWVL